MNLCQLERDGDVGCRIHRLTILGCRTETNLLGHSACFFIQSVSQTAGHALNDDLAGGGEGDAKNHIALDP